MDVHIAKVDDPFLFACRKVKLLDPRVCNPRGPLPTPCSQKVEVIYAWLAGPRAPLGVPLRKPLLNLRDTSFNERMRPVPVVFLLLAFSPQLSVAGNVREVGLFLK